MTIERSYQPPAIAGRRAMDLATHTGWSLRRFRELQNIVERAATLAELAALPPSPLEKTEALEQLRWLEAGYDIWVAEAWSDSIGVDTPEDLARVEDFLKKEAVS